ncbi:MAG: peptidylprolyl isomerase [Gemmatimonadota bacterium]|nr:peptidylprolyl isomerase [Gemmatimonadota bacterium]
MSITRKTILIAVVAAAACGDPEPPAVAVDGVTFTEDQVLGLSEDRREMLAYLAAFGLAVADSTTDELGAPLIERWMDDRRLDALAAELTLEKNDVSDDVLESRYMTDPAWELTVRHILFTSERWRSEEHRAEARAKAERAMERLQDGADFAATAAELSEEPGAEGREGLLEPGREGSWVPEFWEAALALEPGEISPVTETQYGYHILRLEDREVVPFEEARSTVVRTVASRIEDPRAVLDAWLDDQGVTEPEARRAAALAEAERRDVRVPEAERAELERRWEDQVYQWTATFGFQHGLSEGQVAEAALDALSRSGQNANLARADIEERGELFERRYDLRIADGGA